MTRLEKHQTFSGIICSVMHKLRVSKHNYFDELSERPGYRAVSCKIGSYLNDAGGFVSHNRRTFCIISERLELASNYPKSTVAKVIANQAFHKPITKCFFSARSFFDDDDDDPFAIFRVPAITVPATKKQWSPFGDFSGFFNPFFSMFSMFDMNPMSDPKTQLYNSTVEEKVSFHVSR